MDITGLIPFLLPLIQLSGAYLRYLPFSSQLSAARRKLLLQRLLLWAAIDLILRILIFHFAGLSILTYKITLLFAWLPYFLISLTVIHRQLPQQIFAGGMQGIWSLLLHTMGNSAMWLFFIPSAGPQIIAWQAVFFLLAFLLTLPLARRIFRNLMPSQRLINDLPFGYYIAFLPLSICFSSLSMFITNTFPSLKNSPSRFFLFLTFFLLYRYIVLERETQIEQTRQANNNKLMGQQLFFLHNYTLLMQDSQQHLSVLRHDMRHNIRLLYALIEENKKTEAQNLLMTLDETLKKTAIRPFCQNPILNAALSIYINKANSLHIPVTVNVNLPSHLPGYENDFAIVLSNLIENAVIASLKQAPDRRNICLSLQYHNRQVVLSLKNRYDAPLHVDENGFPQAAAKGHGIGMVSLKEFASRHRAYIEYEQKDGWVTCLIYWSMAPLAKAK